MNAKLSAMHAALTAGGWNPGKMSGNKFRAICPVCGTQHTGNNTKLSISEGHRVPVVVRCFAGCGAVAIFNALGFGKKLDEFYPPKLDGGKPGQRWIPAAHALDGLADDAMTIAVFAALVAAGNELTEQQRDELASTRANIESVLKLVSRDGK